MPNSINITITNLPEIKAAFAKAPGLMTNELNTAIRKSVISIGADSRRNTPVLTGRLRASTLEQYSNLKGEVGTHTDYDIFVHWGTKYMRARPYLLEAVESNTEKVDDFFKKAVQTVLDTIAREV